MVLAVAFVKIVDIDKSINLLYDKLPEEIIPLLEWFEEIYVGPFIRNRRRSPRYSPVLWYVHERVLNKEDSTNNYAEAANRRLNIQMEVDLPTLWAIISCLRRIRSGRDTFLRQLQTGKSPPKEKKKYIDLNKRIFKLISQYDNRNVISFLRGLAHKSSLMN